MTMDKRLVTWFWFGDQEVHFQRHLITQNFNKRLAKRLREVADELENKPLHITAKGNVSDSMGTPFGYFESADEAKRFTR